MSKHVVANGDKRGRKAFMTTRELHDYLATQQSQRWPLSKSIHPRAQEKHKMRLNGHLTTEVNNLVASERVLRNHNL